MRKLDNKIKIYLIVGIVSVCVLLTFTSNNNDDYLEEMQFPNEKDRNMIIENAYLDMSIEQLLEVVVGENTSAIMSREAICYLLNDSCMNLIT